MKLVGKTFDFLLYAVIIMAILSVAIFGLPYLEAMVTSVVIFIISSAMIVHVSISSFQRDLIKEAPYHQINYKIFSPFALIISFASICYLLNGVEPQYFVGSKNASIIDFSMFTVDNIIRVVFWDVPEIYGIAATSITHNTDNLGISSFIFLFRTLIGLSLIKMLMVLLRN
jgi:hypothetical protein